MVTGAQRTPPGPGQESVWDYPRPPRLEPTTERLRVFAGGQALAETTAGFRVLETSHPPTYYIPAGDVRLDRLVESPGVSMCEFKGRARYWALAEDPSTPVAWSYPQPTRAFAALADHLSFYASRVESCWVGDERVAAQEGDFYGGWITSGIVGPFKGGPGTWGW